MPIIKAFNEKESIDCDISISNGLGIRNTQLLIYFFSIQPLFREMVCFLKLWKQESNILNKSRFTNYNLTLLIVFYLQTQRLLPTIYELQKNVRPFQIGPWNANFASKSLSQLNIEFDCRIELHVQQFFKYYSCEDLLQSNVLCTFLGKPLPKSNFNDWNSIPDSLMS